MWSQPWAQAGKCWVAFGGLSPGFATSEATCMGDHGFTNVPIFWQPGLKHHGLPFGRRSPLTHPITC